MLTFEIRPLDTLSAAVADRVAASVADAYRAGDPVAGLPVADGCHETGEAIRADLAAGVRLWVAFDGETVAGSVRAQPSCPDGWEIRRLAVAPWTRGTGLGQRLVRAVEDEAAGAGRPVVLNAVVERHTPAFYARLGYRTVQHFAADDKPLSEVRMRRDPAGPGDDTVPGPGVAVHWSHDLHPTVSYRVDGPILEQAGADFWPGAQPSDVPAVRAALDAIGPGPAFRQPRLVHDRLLAWWRGPVKPGR